MRIERAAYSFLEPDVFGKQVLRGRFRNIGCLILLQERCARPFHDVIPWNLRVATFVVSPRARQNSQ